MSGAGGAELNGEFGVAAGFGFVAEVEVEAGKSEIDARVYWSVLQGLEAILVT